MELVSGPDVGGGYLFQLTVDPAAAFARYVVHAQEGGLDGGSLGPGSPSALGFERAPTMCSLGGRHCWHREFEADPQDALRVRFAYNRLRFVFGVLLAQASGDRPVPFDAGAEEVVRRLVPALTAQHVPWIVGGSASARLQGARIEPRDLDLATTKAGVRVIGELLAEYLVEPVSKTRWSDGRESWAARAFVGTLVDGTLVEWRAVSPETPDGSEWSAASLVHPVGADAFGETVPCTPLEFALVKAVRLGRLDRARAIRDRLTEIGVDRPLLDRLLREAGPLAAEPKKIVSELANARERPPTEQPSTRSLGS